MKHRQGLALILSCEHGGNEVPPAYTRYFASHEAQNALGTHRGWDIGALEAAQYLAEALEAPLVFSRISRLLVDLNRSERNPRRFSEFVAPLNASQRQALMDTIHRPYRDEVAALITHRLASYRRVLHISVHSFTPVLGNHVRNADIGLLYDPQRFREKRLARRLKLCMNAVAPDWRVRLNFPYRGISDGFTKTLREDFPREAYWGLEIEINQALLMGSADARRQVHRRLAQALERLLFVAKRRLRLKELATSATR